MERADMTATFYVGDAIEVMNKLPENSVDLVLSSPPFLALRSYLPADHPDKALEGGSQATPGEFIDWLIDVVEACDRVLAPHGSLCFELGDTYVGGSASGGDWTKGKNEFRGGLRGLYEPPTRDISEGWPLPKSLSLIPELFRFTLVYGFNPLTGRQTERWRLRNVIRWVRPNPPVGFLGDKFRPATSELMVFCKSGKRFFDLDAVREAPSQSSIERAKSGTVSKAVYSGGRRDNETGDYMPGGGGSNEVKVITGAHPAGAPPLDWWNIPPGGYPGAHYAVWPPELLVKPIKAMCPEKVCRVCGEPSRRIVEVNPDIRAHNRLVVAGGAARDGRETGAFAGSGYSTVVGSTLGFSDCSHGDFRNGLVLDPFVGSGTTLSVATGHGRDAIGIDLDERNYALALDRVGPMFLTRGEVGV